MSAVAPLLKPLGFRPAEKTAARPVAKARPRLRLVTSPRTAGRVPFAILIGAVMVVGLVTLLMLHTLAAQDGFKLNTLQSEQKTLNDQLQSLQQVVQSDSSPDMLRQRAAALGMVPSVVNSYTQLKDGRARGLEIPVIAPPPVIATTSTTVKAGKTAAKSGSTSKTGTSKTGTTTTGTTKTTAKTTTTGTTTGTSTGTQGTHHKPAHPHR